MTKSDQTPTAFANQSPTTPWWTVQMTRNMTRNMTRKTARVTNSAASWLAARPSRKRRKSRTRVTDGPTILSPPSASLSARCCSFGSLLPGTSQPQTRLRPSPSAGVVTRLPRLSTLALPTASACWSAPGHFTELVEVYTTQLYVS